MFTHEYQRKVALDYADSINRISKNTLVDFIGGFSFRDNVSSTEEIKMIIARLEKMDPIGDVQGDGGGSSLTWENAEKKAEKIKQKIELLKQFLLV